MPEKGSATSQEGLERSNTRTVPLYPFLLREPKVANQDKTPVLDTIAAMTAASLENCDLPADRLLLVRIAALAAVDARPVSYLLHVGPSIESGVTIEDVQNVLVAIAPIIGSARRRRRRSTSRRLSASRSPSSNPKRRNT